MNDGHHSSTRLLANDVRTHLIHCIESRERRCISAGALAFFITCRCAFIGDYAKDWQTINALRGEATVELEIYLRALRDDCRIWLMPSQLSIKIKMGTGIKVVRFS